MTRRLQSMLVLFFACGLMGAAPVSTITLPTPNLCRLGELILASAKTKTRIVSVCAEHAGKERGNAKVSYRYGLPNRIELDLSDVRAASHGFAGGGEDQIIAHNGAYRYVLFQNMIAGQWDAEGNRAHSFGCGLLVVLNNKIVSHQICTPPDSNAIASGLTEEMLPIEEWFEHYES